MGTISSIITVLNQIWNVLFANPNSLEYIALAAQLIDQVNDYLSVLLFMLTRDIAAWLSRSIDILVRDLHLTQYALISAIRDAM